MNKQEEEKTKKQKKKLWSTNSTRGKEIVLIKLKRNQNEERLNKYSKVKTHWRLERTFVEGEERLMEAIDFFFFSFVFLGCFSPQQLERKPVYNYFGMGRKRRRRNGSKNRK